MADDRCPWCGNAATEAAWLPPSWATDVKRCSCGAVLMRPADPDNLGQAACEYFGLPLDEVDLEPHGILSEAVERGGWYYRPGVEDLDREVMGYLLQIERGLVVLTPKEEPQEFYSGRLEYSGSDGSTFFLWNDCNEWDYIEELRLPDGRSLDFDELQELPRVRAYSPDDEVAWLRYGIPGYLQRFEERWLETRGVRSLPLLKARRNAVETEADPTGILRVSLVGAPETAEVERVLDGQADVAPHMLVDLTALSVLREPLIDLLHMATQRRPGRIALIGTHKQRQVFELLGLINLPIYDSVTQALAWLRERGSSG